jgi:Bacterial PH domain
MSTGWLRRYTFEMPVTPFESIRVEQSIVARLLGFGSVLVVGVGTGRQRFTHMARPLAFRRGAGGVRSPNSPRPPTFASALAPGRRRAPSPALRYRVMRAAAPVRPSSSLRSARPWRAVSVSSSLSSAVSGRRRCSRASRRRPWTRSSTGAASEEAAGPHVTRRTGLRRPEAGGTSWSITTTGRRDGVQISRANERKVLRRKEVTAGRCALTPCGGAVLRLAHVGCPPRGGLCRGAARLWVPRRARRPGQRHAACAVGGAPTDS